MSGWLHGRKIPPKKKADFLLGPHKRMAAKYICIMTDYPFMRVSSTGEIREKKNTVQCATVYSEM
jgi:hypothetical protein